eukprot:TRINITY_DN55650_c0_g1_i1.p1 TRINITY_DN55650_c0_g1~~TRINITY_DN55650_c0_g1_i1.p1  ORF type:complete len:631 (+),score=66.63 TRINITY_DN55650_c0_g1_i1:125-1894(+)
MPTAARARLIAVLKEGLTSEETLSQPPPLLLREVSGQAHKSIHESILSGFQLRCEDTENLPTPILPTAIVRGFTSTAREVDPLAEMVANIMKGQGWGEVQKSQLKVEDTSGHGGSKTYKVTAPDGVDPPIIALHSRSEEVVGDPLSEPRMAAAAKLFASHGLAPTRVAQGGDWFIEVWEGIGQPQFQDNESYQKLGQLVAAIHKLPTAWYDEWRDKLCDAHSFLKDVPMGSHVWWYAGRPMTMLGKMEEECRNIYIMSELLAPASTPGQRIVTTHSDLHSANMVQTHDGIKTIDFEFTSVNYAVTDLSYICAWTTMGWHDAAPNNKLEKKRVFLKAYLESMGDASGDQEIDDLFVDAELGWIMHHFSLCAPWETHGKKAGDVEVVAWKKRLDSALAVVKSVREDIGVREAILRDGVQPLLGKIEVGEHLESGRVFLVSKDSPHRCVLEHADKLRNSDEAVPMTLSSHPGLGILEGPKRGPYDHCGYPIHHQFLVMGSAGDAVVVARHEEFLKVDSKIVKDDRRVIDVEGWDLREGKPMGIWNKGPTFIPPNEDYPGQRFEVNEDGTISCSKSASLVFGASKVVWVDPKV